MIKLISAWLGDYGHGYSYVSVNWISILINEKVKDWDSIAINFECLEFDEKTMKTISWSWIRLAHELNI